MVATKNACKGLLALVIFSLTCGPAAGRGIPWYEKYGILSKQELRQVTAVPKLANALKDEDARTRKAAAKTLGGLRAAARGAVPALVDRLADEHPGVRTEAAQSLGEIGPDALAAGPALVRALGDQDADVRLQGLRSLQRLGYRGADFAAALQTMAENDAHRRVKAEAGKLLAALSAPGAAPAAKPTPAIAGGTTSGIELPRTDRVNRYGVAVIIGNRHYAAAGKSVPDVTFAHNDVDAVYRYVTETLGFREGNVIVLKDASQADLVATFGSHNNAKGKVYDWVRPGQSDVFVYYSGHGAPGLADTRSYLLPVDADPNKIELNGYPLETLYANLAQLPAKSTTVILDACFSGGTAAGYVVKNASSITLKPTVVKVDPRRLTVITASGLSQVASWDEKSRHGLFTSYFLQGVSSAADLPPYGNKDGKVTLGELKRYLEEEVTYEARRSYGRDQNPQFNGDPKAVLAELR